MTSKPTIILLALLIVVGVSQAQTQLVTAVYIFDVLFESALGPDAIANSKVCPGICVPSSMSMYCPKIFEELQCATPSTKCCVRKSDSFFPGAQFGTPEPPRLTAGVIPESNEEEMLLHLESNDVPIPSTTNINQAAIIGHNQTLLQTPTISQDEIYQSSLQPSIPAIPAPVCPGFCMLNILRTFCEYPSIVISTTSSCRVGTICCDNRGLIVAQANDHRPECPGICISTSIRFTCYGTAETTELYKCSRPRSVCCASKTHIHEILGATNHQYSDSIQLPYRVTTPHTPTAYTEAPYKVVKPTKLQPNLGGICPGVCVVDMFADYCEAYLTTAGLCEIGSKCCVPPEKYSDQLPPNLRILRGSNTRTTILLPPQVAHNDTARISLEKTKPTEVPIIVPKIGLTIFNSSEVIASSSSTTEATSPTLKSIEDVTTEAPAINL